MSAPSTSGLSVELLLRVIDVKYGYLAWLGLAWLGLAWLGLTWLDLYKVFTINEACIQFGAFH